MLSVIIAVLALVAFVLAAIGWSYRKTDLIAVGLALLVLSTLITRLAGFNVKTLLEVLAFLAFVAAAVGWRYRKINLIAVGLALWTLAQLNFVGS
jgi:hydrogenase-4 membrane subunit HyfE